MGFVYAAAWFAVAVLLFGRFRKESRVIIPVSIYFVFLGVWWLANEFVSADLMQGGYAWILRAVSAVVLMFCVIFYYLEKKKSADASKHTNE